MLNVFMLAFKGMSERPMDAHKAFNDEYEYFVNVEKPELPLKAKQNMCSRVGRVNSNAE